MLPGLLQGVDRDLAGVLKKRLDRKFRSIMLETKLASLSELDNEVEVLFEADGKSFREKYEKVLISVGRVPYTEGLGLENTRVAVDRKGFIETDTQRRTADPAIFAVGDVAGEPMLAHKATYEARIVAEVITGARDPVRPTSRSGSHIHRPRNRLVRNHRKRGEGDWSGNRGVEISLGRLGKSPYA